MQPKIIKGDAGGPTGKWEQVQAIQHEPFIYIQSCGSRWAGEEEGDVVELLEVLKTYRLRDGFGSYYSVNPCRGVVNPKWGYGPSEPYYTDGPRMYACDGVVRFFGNFEEVSHVFNIDTNHKPTIDALVAAIHANVLAKANRFANLLPTARKRREASAYIGWLRNGAVGLEPRCSQAIKQEINAMNLWA